MKTFSTLKGLNMFHLHQILSLTVLHSEWPKFCRVFAILSVVAFKQKPKERPDNFCYLKGKGDISPKNVFGPLVNSCLHVL